MMALFPVLKQRADQTAETLSGGEQQMLAIARPDVETQAAHARRDVPGLMPALVERDEETIVEINRSGITILLSSRWSRRRWK